MRAMDRLHPCDSLSGTRQPVIQATLEFLLPLHKNHLLCTMDLVERTGGGGGAECSPSVSLEPWIRRGLLNISYVFHNLVRVRSENARMFLRPQDIVWLERLGQLKSPVI
jgi:hypothetical protein